MEQINNDPKQFLECGPCEQVIDGLEQKIQQPQPMMAGPGGPQQFIMGPGGRRDDHVMDNYSAYYCSRTMGGRCHFDNSGKCSLCGMTREEKDKAREKAKNSKK
mmetsp:Transcript_18882/g.29616  ORF Transcript_18882/g.29616 Transcript_18882/m.29616 type:complete len:104 (-) Transcript_18882:202-513(-)